MRLLKVLLALLLLPVVLPVLLLRRLFKKGQPAPVPSPPDSEGRTLLFPDVGIRFSLSGTGWAQEPSAQGEPLTWRLAGVAPLAVLMRAVAEEVGITPVALRPEHAQLRLVTEALRRHLSEAVYEPLSDGLGLVLIAKQSSDSSAMMSVTEEALTEAGLSRETYKQWALVNVKSPSLRHLGTALCLESPAPNAALALLKDDFVTRLKQQLGPTFLVLVPSHMTFAVSKDDDDGRASLERIATTVSAKGMADLSTRVYRVGQNGWSRVILN